MKVKDIPFRNDEAMKGFAERVLERARRSVETVDEADLTLLKQEYQKYQDASVNWLVTRTFSKLADVSGELGYYVGSLPDIDFSDKEKRFNGYRATFVNDHKAFTVRFKGSGNSFKKGCQYKVRLGRSGFSRGEPEATDESLTISKLLLLIDSILTPINKIDQYDTVALKVVVSDLFPYRYWLTLKMPVKRKDDKTNKELPDKKNEKAGETKLYGYRVPGTDTVLKEFADKVKGSFKSKLTLLYKPESINQLVSDSISIVMSTIDPRRDQISVEIPPAIQNLYRPTLYFPYSKETMLELKELYNGKEFESIESVIRTEFMHQQIYVVGIVSQVGEAKADKKGRKYRFRSMDAAFVAVDDSFEMPEGFLTDKEETDDEEDEITDFETTSSDSKESFDDDDFYDEEEEETDPLPEITDEPVKESEKSEGSEESEKSEGSKESEKSGEAGEFEDEEDSDASELDDFEGDVESTIGKASDDEEEFTDADFEELEVDTSLSKIQKKKLDEMFRINVDNPDIPALAKAVGSTPDIVQDYIDSNREKFAKEVSTNLTELVKKNLSTEKPQTIPAVVKAIKEQGTTTTNKEVAKVVAKLLAKDEVLEGPTKRYRYIDLE